MLLWTIQPASVYDRIQREGVYRFTNREHEDLKEFPWAYSWLNEELTKRIGPPPAGVVGPARGWLRWEPERVRPDLRWMRWNWGPWGEHVLMQIDIPESQVVFLDFECWCLILTHSYIDDNEEESERVDKELNCLSEEEAEKRIRESWQKAFDIEYVPDDYWRGKGYEVEALFWELRKEQIRSAKRFVSGAGKSETEENE